jgi:predicted amidohydrolase YtcJ
MSTEPDFVLLNGKITTLDRAKPEAQALAIKDGGITAVGSDREIGPLAGPRTKKIELGKRRVVPGLIPKETSAPLIRSPHRRDQVA